MPHQEQRAKKYKKILYEDRRMLIKRVCEDGLSIVEAAKEIKIHPSTARMIIIKYKEDGIIFQAKQDRLRRTLAEEIQRQKQKKKSNQAQQISSLTQPVNVSIPFVCTVPVYWNPFLPQWGFNADS